MTEHRGPPNRAPRRSPSSQRTEKLPVVVVPDEPVPLEPFRGPRKPADPSVHEKKTAKLPVVSPAVEVEVEAPKRKDPRRED